MNNNESKIIAELLSLLSNGGNDSNNNILLEDFGREIIKYSTPIRSKKTIKVIETAFRQFVNFAGNIPLNKVDKRIIDLFISSTFQKAPESAKAYFRYLKAAFQKAFEWNYISENPFKDMRPPKTSEPEIITISHEDLETVSAAITSPIIKEIVQFAVNTGLRVSEIVNLKWSSINLAERIINIVNSNTYQTKSKKNRIVPINQKCFKVLSERVPQVIKINKSQYVFFLKSSDIKLTEDYVSRRFKRAVIAAGVDNRITFHALRRTFASNLVQNNCSVYEVQKLLGHSDIRMTETFYAKLKIENLHDAVAKLDQIIITK